MSFLGLELSVFGGKPIELYEFACGTNLWLYTSADEDKTIDNVVYKKASIKRGSLSLSQEQSKNSLTLTIDKDLPVLNQFRVAPPAQEMSLKLKRYHHGDGQMVTPWVGTVLNVKFNERGAEVKCETVNASLSRPTLRRMYQRSCPHVLYGVDCAVSAPANRVSCKIDSVKGTLVFSPDFLSKPSDYFSGGFIDFNHSGFNDRRFIVSHSGNQITLNVQMPSLKAGSVIQVYAGCDHTLKTCVEKFNNVENYGGMPFIPDKNPTGGTPIF